jgi:hypothetical protein
MAGKMTGKTAGKTIDKLSKLKGRQKHGEE